MNRIRGVLHDTRTLINWVTCFLTGIENTAYILIWTTWTSYKIKTKDKMTEFKCKAKLQTFLWLKHAIDITS